MTDLSFQLGTVNYGYGELEMKLKKWGKRIGAFIGAVILSQGINAGSKNIEYTQVQEPPGYTQTLEDGIAFGPKIALAYGRSLSKVDYSTPIANSDKTIQRAYAYFKGLADYGADGTREPGISNNQAAKIILGIDNRRVNDTFLSRVPGGVRQTSPIYAMLRASLDFPINRDEITKLNFYFQNLVLGINEAWCNHNKTQARTHFARNIFEIASLGPKEFEIINLKFPYANVEYQIDKNDSLRTINNWDLADTFLKLPLLDREWILQEVVRPYIKSKSKTPKNQFNENDPNLKWKYFYFSLGQLGTIEMYTEDKSIGYFYLEKSSTIYRDLTKIFGYHTLSKSLNFYE